MSPESNSPVTLITAVRSVGDLLVSLLYKFWEAFLLANETEKQSLW